MSFIKHPFIKPETIESKLYQEVIAARVLEKGNTLVVAPTALGKTIIAILVAAERLKQGKKILFLSPTKPLAVQHEKSFIKFLNLDEKDIICLTGTLTPEKRRKAFSESKVISATPQSIQNDIVSGEISLNEIGLLIFDEAHRATGNYSYVYLAEQYSKQSAGLVLALTASPGGEEEKIQSVCRNLYIKNVEVKTNEDEDVKEYVNKVAFEWVKVELPQRFKEAKILIENFQKEQIDSLRKIGIGLKKKYFSKKDILAMQADVRKQLIQTQNPTLYTASSKLAALLKISHLLTQLETQGTYPAYEYIQKLESDSNSSNASKAVKSITQSMHIMKAKKIIESLIKESILHPKLDALKHILVEQLDKNPESKIIVFNHYRANIREIEKQLKEVEGIKAKRFVGQATKGEDKGLTQKEQVKVIEDLKEGKYNTLLASSVAEEGLDIPQVDLVVFYEPVPSEIRMIQRKGRTGRKSEGKAIVLMAKETRDEAFYYASRAKERLMHSTLKQLQQPRAIPEKRLDSQTTLSKYAPGFAEKIIIYADTREQASQAVLKLTEYDLEVKVKQLEVGDFILSDNVCVERKTVSDFLTSVVDGRLFNQLTMMVSNYASPLIIIEGNPQELFTERNIHENAIRGILSSIALNYRVPIIYTRDVDETVRYLFLIAKKEQLGKENEIKLRVGRKGLTKSEQQQFLVEGFPLVGPGLAKSMLKKFGTVRAIVNASVNELQEIEKMGPKKAKKILEVLNSVYGED